MKVILFTTLIAVFAVFVAANPTGQSASILNSEATNNEQEYFPMLHLGADFHRYRKSYGSGGGYMPSIPCPKNYLFSCKPNLTPAPCASGGDGYGSSGAYTAPVPAYASPIYF